MWIAGLGKRSFQVNATFMRSFEVNAVFSAFICVHLKWSQRSLRSFAFTWSECKWTLRSFGSHKSPKTRKMNAKERFVLKMNANERCVLNPNERGAQPWWIVNMIFLCNIWTPAGAGPFLSALALASAPAKLIGSGWLRLRYTGQGSRGLCRALRGGGAFFIGGVVVNLLTPLPLATPMLL